MQSPCYQEHRIQAAARMQNDLDSTIRLSVIAALPIRLCESQVLTNDVISILRTACLEQQRPGQCRPPWPQVPSRRSALRPQSQAAAAAVLPAPVAALQEHLCRLARSAEHRWRSQSIGCCCVRPARLLLCPSCAEAPPNRLKEKTCRFVPVVDLAAGLVDDLDPLLRSMSRRPRTRWSPPGRRCSRRGYERGKGRVGVLASRGTSEPGKTDRLLK